jgi:hypothetical protein
VPDVLVVDELVAGTHTETLLTCPTARPCFAHEDDVGSAGVAFVLELHACPVFWKGPYVTLEPMPETEPLP